MERKLNLALCLLAIVVGADLLASPAEARQFDELAIELAADEPSTVPDPAAESVGEPAEDAPVEGEPGPNDTPIVPADEDTPLDGAGGPAEQTTKDTPKSN